MTTLRRSLLDGVLAVVQDLGGSTGLQAALDVIADAVVDVLGFGAAAINVTTADGDLRVDAVVGPPGVQQLLDTRRPMSFWLDVLGAAEPWGELRFFSHERDQALVDQFASWRPSTTRTLDPDAWHPDDSLLAPMWGMPDTIWSECSASTSANRPFGRAWSSAPCWRCWPPRRRGPFTMRRSRRQPRRNGGRRSLPITAVEMVSAAPAGI